VASLASARLGIALHGPDSDVTLAHHRAVLANGRTVVARRLLVIRLTDVYLIRRNLNFS